MENTFTPFTPQPRYASTVELNLLDLLTTEAQAKAEQDTLDFVRAWVADAYCASLGR